MRSRRTLAICRRTILLVASAPQYPHGVIDPIGALAAKVKQMTGSRSEIVMIPYEKAYEAGFEDMPRRVPDISRIKALVGYEPAVELEETLTRNVYELAAAIDNDVPETTDGRPA